jgi:hypothetical protein
MLRYVSEESGRPPGGATQLEKSAVGVEAA